ncbi:AbiJ-NTD4 domain-containing protein [Pelagibacterium sp.]|uniref:AbiJ-NTD4 domain-containing protein n=1 Tax=Pelagibacterium sp. TaxID=1967288 RepID=UPI003BAC486C
MASADYETRKELSFKEAEGLAKVPPQLRRTEISPQLRSLVWSVIFEHMTTTGRRGFIVTESWREVLLDKHIDRDHLMIDEFDGEHQTQSRKLKHEIQTGSFGDFYDLLQWLMRHDAVSYTFADEIDSALKKARSAYRVVNRDTLLPLSTEYELAALKKAFSDTSGSYVGSYSHLRRSADLIASGKWADSVRESIHAVEALAKLLEPSAKELGPALAKIQKAGGLHEALKKGFSALYGFTSDENGIRHSLLDKGEANVDEADALYMLGACAAFVSYLISRSRAAGLTSQ